MRSLGSFLRIRRQALGLKQADVAEGICSDNTISRIEKGDQMPTVFVFTQVLEKLGVPGFSYGDFFDGESSRELALKLMITEKLEDRRLENIPELLSRYAEGFLEDGNLMSGQFFAIARALFYYFETGNESRLWTEAKRALMMTRRNFEKEFLGGSRLYPIGSFLTQSELSCANAVAVGLAKEGRVADAITIINRLIISALSSECCLPVYSKNAAVLLNNAAIFEEELYPDESREHIAEAVKMAAKGAGISVLTRILKNHSIICRDRKTQLLYQLLIYVFNPSSDVFGKDRFLYVF